MLVMERIRSRFATTGFMVEAFLKVQLTVGVLSLPERGDRHSEDLQTSGKVSLWRNRDASSRSEFVIRPFGLVILTRYDLILSGHWRRQT